MNVAACGESQSRANCSPGEHLAVFRVLAANLRSTRPPFNAPARGPQVENPGGLNEDPTASIPRISTASLGTRNLRVPRTVKSGGCGDRLCGREDRDLRFFGQHHAEDLLEGEKVDA